MTLRMFGRKLPGHPELVVCCPTYSLLRRRPGAQSRSDLLRKAIIVIAGLLLAPAASAAPLAVPSASALEAASQIEAVQYGYGRGYGYGRPRAYGRRFGGYAPGPRFYGRGYYGRRHFGGYGRGYGYGGPRRFHGGY